MLKMNKRNQKAAGKMKNKKHMQGGAIVINENQSNKKSLILNFKYKKNTILKDLLQTEEDKEMGVIL